jgi:hypothetical protein
MDPNILKIFEAAGRWRSEEIFDAIHQPKAKKEWVTDYLKTHRVGNAPTHEAPSAQDQDDPQECSWLGLTRALVVKKCRGLSRKI